MQMKHVACGLAFLSACAVVLLSLSQRSSISSQLQTPRHVRVHLGPANPLMKNIVIDKVYFPPGSHDSGLASVHGVVNGEYVQVAPPLALLPSVLKAPTGQLAHQENSSLSPTRRLLVRGRTVAYGEL